MLRQVLRLLLLLAVFNHGTALPGTAQVAIQFGGGASHAALHWQGLEHHHHDDGTVHTHDGAEAAQHLQIDNMMQSPALMPPYEASPGAKAEPVTPVPLPYARPKAAFPDVLERPPRTRS